MYNLRRSSAQCPRSSLGDISPKQAGEPSLGRLPHLQSVPEGYAAGLGPNDRTDPHALASIPAFVADDQGLRLVALLEVRHGELLISFPHCKPLHVGTGFAARRWCQAELGTI